PWTNMEHLKTLRVSSQSPMSNAADCCRAFSFVESVLQPDSAPIADPIASAARTCLVRGLTMRIPPSGFLRKPLGGRAAAVPHLPCRDDAYFRDVFGGSYERWTRSTKGAGPDLADQGGPGARRLHRCVICSSRSCSPEVAPRVALAPRRPLPARRRSPGR